MSGLAIRAQMRNELYKQLFKNNEFLTPEKVNARVAVKYRHFRRREQRRKIRDEIIKLTGNEPKKYLLKLRQMSGDQTLVLSNREILEQLQTKL